MKPLSVIIPTLQFKNKILNKLLDILEKDSVVDEILLINNAPKKFTTRKKLTKLKIYNQSKNLFVNQSWNFGIKHMKNDYFLIINDDVLCPYNFCSTIMSSDIFDKENTGLVGLYHWQINNYDASCDDMEIPEFDNKKSIDCPVRHDGTGLV